MTITGQLWASRPVSQPYYDHHRAAVSSPACLPTLSWPSQGSCELAGLSPYLIMTITGQLWARRPVSQPYHDHHRAAVSSPACLPTLSWPSQGSCELTGLSPNLIMTITGQLWARRPVSLPYHDHHSECDEACRHAHSRGQCHHFQPACQSGTKHTH